MSRVEFLFVAIVAGGCASQRSSETVEEKRAFEIVYSAREVQTTLDLGGWRLSSSPWSNISPQTESGHLRAWKDGDLRHIESCSDLAALLGSWDGEEDVAAFYSLVDGFLLDEGIAPETWKFQRIPECCDPGISRVDLEIHPMAEFVRTDGGFSIIERRAVHGRDVALVLVTLGPKRYEVAPR